MVITGLDLIEYIAKKLEEDDVRVYDSNIINYLKKMSHAELISLLNNWSEQMNYTKLYYRLIDSIDMGECNIRRLKLIHRVKLKASIPPMNLGQSMFYRAKL